MNLEFGGYFVRVIAHGKGLLKVSINHNIKKDILFQSFELLF